MGETESICSSKYASEWTTRISPRAWDLLPGAPVLTGTGLTPAGRLQREAHGSTASSVSSRRTVPPRLGPTRSNGSKAYRVQWVVRSTELPADRAARADSEQERHHPVALAHTPMSINMRI